MKFGFYTPNFGVFGDARVLADLAHEAENAGWDGFFIWDHLQFVEPTADPWVALAAMTMRTARIRLGPLVTPVPRRHIVKLAREVITLDHLSGGRVVLGVGAGYPAMPDYSAFGDPTDLRVRAAMLDEALLVLAALWSGEPVKHHGAHYHVECDAFQPPVQRPRVPVWVAAGWPSKKPLTRAARWDGIVPTVSNGLDVEPADLREMASRIQQMRGSGADFDIIRFGQTQNSSDTAAVKASAEAGATWWLEYIYTDNSSLDDIHARILAGPPRL